MDEQSVSQPPNSCAESVNQAARKAPEPWSIVDVLTMYDGLSEGRPYSAFCDRLNRNNIACRLKRHKIDTIEGGLMKYITKCGATEKQRQDARGILDRLSALPQPKRKQTKTKASTKASMEVAGQGQSNANPVGPGSTPSSDTASSAPVASSVATSAPATSAAARSSPALSSAATYVSATSDEAGAVPATIEEANSQDEETEQVSQPVDSEDDQDGASISSNTVSAGSHSVESATVGASLFPALSSAATLASAPSVPVITEEANNQNEDTEQVLQTVAAEGGEASASSSTAAAATSSEEESRKRSASPLPSEPSEATKRLKVLMNRPDVFFEAASERPPIAEWQQPRPAKIVLPTYAQARMQLPYPENQLDTTVWAAGCALVALSKPELVEDVYPAKEPTEPLKSIPEIVAYFENCSGHDVPYTTAWWNLPALEYLRRYKITDTLQPRVG